MDDMDKTAKLEKVISGLNAARATGMNFIANFMIGHPEETVETVNETIEFCRKMELAFLRSYVVLFPNSKMFHDNKHKVKSWDWYFKKLTRVDFTRKPFINLTKMPDADLVRLRNKAVSLTVTYKIFGKDNATLVRFMAPLMAIALKIVEASPRRVHWAIRNLARALFDIKSSKAKQIAPFNLGAPAIHEEDSYEDSLKELERRSN